MDIRKWVDLEEIIRFVQTTPDLIEADSVCRNALAQIVGEQAACIADRRTPPPKLAEYRRRLQSELHRIQTVNHEINWKQAVLAVGGDDLYRQCATWLSCQKAERMP